MVGLFIGGYTKSGNDAVHPVADDVCLWSYVIIVKRDKPGYGLVADSGLGRFVGPNSRRLKTRQPQTTSPDLS